MGLGTAISALARNVMQAVLVVPLILIPQILFSGYTVKSADMGSAVHAVARVMPTFASQKIIETSFLWNQQVGKSAQNHFAAMLNLKKMVPFATNDIFTNPWPALTGLLTHAVWVTITYFIAFAALKSRERRR